MNVSLCDCVIDFVSRKQSCVKSHLFLDCLWVGKHCVSVSEIFFSAQV